MFIPVVKLALIVVAVIFFFFLNHELKLGLENFVDHSIGNHHQHCGTRRFQVTIRICPIRNLVTPVAIVISPSS